MTAGFSFEISVLRLAGLLSPISVSFLPVSVSSAVASNTHICGVSVKGFNVILSLGYSRTTLRNVSWVIIFNPSSVNVVGISTPKSSDLILFLLLSCFATY